MTRLVHELPNDLRLRKLGNIRKMSNVGGDAAQRPVPIPEIRYHTPETPFNFTASLQPVPNTLARIVDFLHKALNYVLLTVSETGLSNERFNTCFTKF